MEKKLIKWNESNYEIEITFTDQEKEKTREEIIRHFWKDVKIPWFRNGNAPLNLIEEKLNPEYIEMWMYEKIVNKWLHEVLDEKTDIKFIWEPYDLKKDDKENKVSIKLDIYPEIEVLDDKRKSNKMWKIENNATDDEVEDSFINLKKNYADYKDTEKIEKDTVSKVSLDFLDKDWKSLETWTLFIWEPEFKESKFYDVFVWKEKGKDFDLEYKEKDLPAVFHKRKQEKTPSKIKVNIKDVKKVILPDFTEETLQKLFPDQKEIKNEKQLKNYIKDEIWKQKYEWELVKNIEEYISKIRDQSMKIIIPQTLIHEEFKSRMDSLEKRFGSKEKVTEYFQQLGEEKTKQFVEEISKASQDSLEKFFILQKVTEELGIKIDRQKWEPLDAEKKLYEKVMWK